MGELLRSWKEIAGHLGTSVRTAQRWEREFQLPVRRIEAKRGAVVFAYPGELKTWLQSRSQHPPLVKDSYFRTVFMDSQFPSLVVDDLPRILEANVAARHLLGVPGAQLLGEKLEWFLCADRQGHGLGDWAGFLKSGACFGKANLKRHDGRALGVEFVVKRFAPGLHVMSVLSAAQAWPNSQLWCRQLRADFGFSVRKPERPILKAESQLRVR